MSLKEKFKKIVRDTKKTKYGAVWYSPVGPIAITNKGEVARFGSPLPKYKEKEV